MELKRYAREELVWLVFQPLVTVQSRRDLETENVGRLHTNLV